MNPAPAASSFRTSLSRRKFFRQGMMLGSLAAAPWIVRGQAVEEKKVGIAAAFDREMEAFMAARNVPGGALAVVKDLKLVYARGYGWADREGKVPARAESLFRIASISKPFTSAAIMCLVEAGKLGLDDAAFELLKLEPLPQEKSKPDERLRRITVRQLLNHTGGWDRGRSSDPMFLPERISQAAGVPSPPGARDIIRYMLGRPLDFDPGTSYAYSNFGYAVLGRLIEKCSGLDYGAFVQKHVRTPAGIKRMRLGASLESGRVEDEVKYYLRTAPQERSVFASHPGRVSAPYGGFCLEAMDAHGGWIASAVDLVRFAVALNDPQKDWLKPVTRKLLYEPPAAPVSRRADGRLEDAFYASGWQVRPVNRQGGANYWHNGSLPGTSTLLVRRWDGLTWAALFNQRSDDSKLPDNAIDPALHRAAAAVAEWPKEDLFSKFA